MQSKKAVLWMIFLLYLGFLIWLLFFDSYYNRSGIKADLQTCFALKTNFVPFATIDRYITNMSNHVQTGSAMLNIFGNLAAFMPMGFLLPVLVKPMRKALIFIPFMLVVLVTVEGMQLLMRVGSCDIDDIILNLAGALIIFLFMKLPWIQKRIKQF